MTQKSKQRKIQWQAAREVNAGRLWQSKSIVIDITKEKKRRYNLQLILNVRRNVS